MAEDATDVQSPDITPDDFMADEQESPKAESSPVKEEAKAEPEEKPAVEESKEDGVEAPEKPDLPEKEETEDDSKEETPEDTPEDAEETKPEPTKAEERKAQLNTEIRDLVAQRNELKSIVEKTTAQVYQPATESDLMEEGMSTTDAKLEAMRQNLEVKEYNDSVTEAHLTLGSESLRVLNDFPIFNPDSDQFDSELAQEAAEHIENNLIRDPNVPEVDPETGQPTGKGLIIGSRVSPYKFYKTLARASSVSETKGQLKGQQAQQKMMANADSPAAAAPPKKTKDPLDDLWSQPL